MVSALRMCLNVAEPLRKYLHDNSDWSRRLDSNGMRNGTRIEAGRPRMGSGNGGIGSADDAGLPASAVMQVV